MFETVPDPDALWAKLRRQFQFQRASREPLPEQLHLKQIRAMRRAPQWAIAATMGRKQTDVSKLEGRTDLRVSSLSSYIAAMGGTLDLVARFPGLLIRIKLGRP
jgi:hypothetical protein